MAEIRERIFPSGYIKRLKTRLFWDTTKRTKCVNIALQAFLSLLLLPLRARGSAQARASSAS